MPRQVCWRVIMAMEGEEDVKGKRRGNPLLWGRKRERYTHGLHPAQMEALRAMCGALIPSLAVEGLRADKDGGHGDQLAGGTKDDLERFYLASAADGTIPDEVRFMKLVTHSSWQIHTSSLFYGVLCSSLPLFPWHVVTTRNPCRHFVLVGSALIEKLQPI